MSQKAADRNLLIGVLAVQMEFVTRDQLIRAMNAWLLDKTLSLDTILWQQSVIDDDTQRLLVGLVDKHIALHSGSATESLASISQTVGIPVDLNQIADAEISKTMSLLPQVQKHPDPLVTAAPPLAKPMAASGIRFRVLRPHSAGGLGTVSVACDEELGREVALKEIKESFADHAESRRRFLIEAEITGCLEHPGIVPVYGLGQYADGRPFYAMRFIRGESLQNAIDRFQADKELDLNPHRRELELRKLLRRLIDVCNAMEYAHSRGVLHRDLKPDNVMLGKYGETLVVDWGLAKADDQIEITNRNEPPLKLLSGGGTSSTQMGACLGTPAFMSPEQASGRLDLMRATSDIYSLGATLYAILTGRAPITEGNLENVLRQVRSGEFQRPRAHDTRIEKPLEAICLKAMALKPEDRYESAAGFAADLERWLADEPVSACVEPVMKRVARWSRHHRALVSSIIACTIASILILSVSLVFLVSANNAERIARNVADSERQRAESNLTVAKQAVSTMLTEVGREELAQFPQMEQTRQKLLARARSFYDEFLKQRPTDESLRFEWAIALRNLAEIDRLVDNHQQAEDRYLQSIAELQALAKAQPSTDSYRRQLASVLNDIGRLVQSRNAGRAEDFFDQAIDLQQSLMQDEPGPELSQELARSFYNRGLVRAEQGNRDTARSDVNAAIEGLKNILKESESPDPSVTQELARCYNNLGNIFQTSGDRTAARRQFTNAIELLDEKIKKQPGDRDIVKELAIFQNNFANMLRADGELATADVASMQAIQKLASLAEPIPLLANELANAHHSRGVILSQRQLLQDAEIEYKLASDILKRLTSEFPDVSLYHDRLGNAFFQLGTMRFQSKQPDEAIPLIQDAMREHTAALKQSPTEPDFRQHLKNDFVGLTFVQLDDGQHAAAFETCIELSKEFASDGAALVDAAQLTARCIPIAEKDRKIPSDEDREKLMSTYTAGVVETLNAALHAGFRDVAKIDKSFNETGAFHPLRKNPELIEIVQRIRMTQETQ